MQGLRVLYFVGFLWLVNFLAKTQRREDLKKNKSIPDGQVFRRGNRQVRLIAVLAKADCAIHRIRWLKPTAMN
ncbi:MAG: hypothetical protein JWQ85_4140 [Mucilaginibacter sp.]|nr:hypothetical protein [Mucilaginibacter sp.]